MKIFLIVFISLFLVDGFSQAKEAKAPIVLDSASLGFGYGIDYGGIGGSLLFYPHRNLGLFAGVGYTPAGVAYNGGIKFRLATKNQSFPLVPFIIGMYGTNAGVAIENGEQYNKLFYGATLGFGTDLKRKPSKHSFFTLAFLFPVYDTKIDDYVRNLRNNHSVQIKNTLEPMTLSVGFRFILK